MIPDIYVNMDLLPFLSLERPSWLTDEERPSYPETAQIHPFIKIVGPFPYFSKSFLIPFR